MTAEPCDYQEPPSTQAVACMTGPEKMRLRSAAFRATRVYPGPVGELVARELLAWEEFGWRFSGKSPVLAIVEHVMGAEVPS